MEPGSSRSRRRSARRMPVTVTDKQVRKLMEEMSKHDGVCVASLRAGMDRKTGRKYIREKRLPSELKEPRSWRTRPDAFAEDWGMVEEMLVAAPELEAKVVFEEVLMPRRETYKEEQLRTFQRRVKEWRAVQGPPREVWFPQVHRPGEAMQTDFTWANELEVTIGGVPFAHKLCHGVLPYSNWQWATVCQSESMPALKRGVQRAVFRLGRVPEWHQTDNSTAATHDLRTGKRGFNSDYETLMKYLGMKPRTIGVGESEQNGDVESANGALKRRLKQHLILRGSKDFGTVEAYQQWLDGVLDKANARRETKVREELAVMRELLVTRLPEYREERIPVSDGATIRVQHNTYSVASRLVGEQVRVRVYEDRLEVYFGAVQQVVMERLLGRGGHRIDYRHVIWSLMRKPGAFARYRYRDDLFPTVTFRRAYDSLLTSRVERKADIEYLRILHLAASTMESEVEAALELLLEAGEVPESDKVKTLLSETETTVPDVSIEPVDLTGYDALLEMCGGVS